MSGKNFSIHNVHCPAFVILVILQYLLKYIISKTIFQVPVQQFYIVINKSQKNFWQQNLSHATAYDFRYWYHYKKYENQSCKIFQGKFASKDVPIGSI